MNIFFRFFKFRFLKKDLKKRGKNSVISINVLMVFCFSWKINKFQKSVKLLKTFSKKSQKIPSTKTKVQLIKNSKKKFLNFKSIVSEYQFFGGHSIYKL